MSVARKQATDGPMKNRLGIIPGRQQDLGESKRFKTIESVVKHWAVMG
jgi:hypothetical protein